MNSRFAIIYILIFLALPHYLIAKNYTAALGARFELGKHGNEGITYKYFMTKNHALEGMVLSDFKSGIEFHAVYLFHGTLPKIPSNFKWFIGGGAHVGVWEEDDFVFGPDGLLGIEYTFNDIPLSIALDWHPVYNLITEKDENYWPIKFGLTARYTF